MTLRSACQNSASCYQSYDQFVCGFLNLLFWSHAIRTLYMTEVYLSMVRGDLPAHNIGYCSIIFISRSRLIKKCDEYQFVSFIGGNGGVLIWNIYFEQQYFFILSNELSLDKNIKESYSIFRINTPFEIGLSIYYNQC